MRASATLTTCPACRRSLGERDLRGLCRSCYYGSPAVRSCFDSSGRQIADLPPPTAGAAGAAGDSPLPAPPPIVLTAPAGPLSRGPGQPKFTAEEAEQLLLAALDALTAGPLAHTLADGTRAAGVRAVVRRAGLPEKSGRAAVLRLVAAGKLREASVMAGQAAVGGGFNQRRPVMCVRRP